MRKLLVGVIKFAGRQLERLGEIHQREAVHHYEIGSSTRRELAAKADALHEQAERALQDGIESARKSREEAARCLAVAQAVQTIN